MRTTPYDAIADIYGLWTESAPITRANGRYYVERFLEADGAAVELGVGDGRISVEAARRGKPMIGVDSSGAMLDLCRARANEAGVAERLTLIQADFRDFELADPADLIAIPFHSIGHMLTRDEQRACMTHVFQQLAPGGRFLFDHFVPDLDYARAHDGQPSLRATEQDETTGGQLVLWAVSSYAFADQRIDIRVITENLDAEGVTTRRQHRELQLSWLEVEQSRALLEEAGFKVESCHGDFDGAPLGPDSHHQVWVARRP